MQQQQQNKNVDALGRPSPAQGSIAPDTDTMQTQLRSKEQAAKQTVSSQNNKGFPAKTLSATLPSTPSVITKPSTASSSNSSTTTPTKSTPVFNAPTVIRPPLTPTMNSTTTTTPTKPQIHTPYNSHNSKPAPAFTINVTGALMKPGADVEEPQQQIQKVQSVQPETPKVTPKPIDKKELFKFVDLANVDSVKLRKCVVQINNLPEEDLQLMQTDLKKFIEKSPKLAAKLGLRKDNEGLFMKMKEDGML